MIKYRLATAARITGSTHTFGITDKPFGPATYLDIFVYYVGSDYYDNLHEPFFFFFCLGTYYNRLPDRQGRLTESFANT